MKMRNWSNLRLGLVSAAVLSVVVVTVVALTTAGLGDTRHTAELPHTAGLRSGDQVKVAGVRVGEVTDLELEGDHVLASFRIDHSVHAGDRTRASVKLATLLGGRYLDLAPAGDGELPGGRITKANVTVPFDLQHVLESTAPTMEQLDSGKLRQSLQEVTGAMRGSSKDTVAATMNGLTRISEVVNKREDQLGGLLASADALTQMVNQDKAQLFTLMGQADQLTRMLLERRDLIRGILTNFRTLTEQLHDTLAENQEQIQPMLANASGILDILQRTDGAIDRALEVLAPAARYMTNATGNGPYADINLPYSVLPDNLLCLAQAVGGCR